MKNKKLGLIKGKEDLRDKKSIDYLKLNNETPKTYDLTSKFTPIEDQGNLGSCTAQAAAAIVEYYEKNVFGKYTNLSRLFTYKVTRNFEKSRGDVGATIRGTLGSLRLIGACPETYYPYKIDYFDKEPSTFLYALASNYKAIDYANITFDEIKKYISNNIPIICGIDIFDNFYESIDGVIEMPVGNNIGGHAVVLCGYDQDYFYFRNSWGTSWGNNGYGKLPIDYIKNYGFDFWILSKMNYISISQFK